MIRTKLKKFQDRFCFSFLFVLFSKVDKLYQETVRQNTAAKTGIKNHFCLQYFTCILSVF